MALDRCNPIEQREFDKFCEDSNLDIAVRTCTEITGGSLEATPAGYSKILLVTTVSVGDTAQLLPATVNREAFSFFNNSQVDTVYYGPTIAVTADSVVGTTSGWPVGPEETANEPIKSINAVYVIAPAGKTVIITFKEMGN